MSDKLKPFFKPEVAALIEQAEAEGRHGGHRQHMCEGCGNLVDALHHVRLDGKYVCRACAPAEGCKCPLCKPKENYR